MMKPFAVAVALGISLAAAVPAHAAVSSAARAAWLARSAALQRDARGDVLHPRDVRDLGRAPSNLPVRVALIMRAQHESELSALVSMQNDPKSSYYKHYLTSAQWRSYFAPDATTYARTLRMLAARGFRVTQTYANRGMIRAVVPSGVAERYFNTQIHRVTQGSHVRYMNVSAITVPAEMSSVAASVAGLHDVQIVHFDHVFRHPQRTSIAQAQTRSRALGVAVRTRPDYAGATAAPYKSPEPIATSTPAANPAPDPTIAPDTGMTDYLNYMSLGPGVFAGGYDFPVQHGYGGKGQAAASVIDADYLNSDVKLEFSTFGIPRTDMGTRVFVGAPYVSTDADGAGESTLDAETIMSLAPSATFYEYLTQFFDDEGIDAAYEQIVSDDLAGAVNSSFGGCETDDPEFEYQTDYVAMEGAAEGITFSASTGDTGGASCGVYAANGAPQTLKSVSIPAADYYFVGVGGTDYLYVVGVDSNTYPTAGENGWTFGGGGSSQIEPLPTWQAATAGVATTGRNIPDVSFVADPDPPSSGEVIFDGGAAEGSGGTSLASPVFIALQTEINEIEKTKNGWVTPRLYAIQNAQGYYAFHDILTGTNVEQIAGMGYDEVTGIGSVDGFKLAGEE